MGTDEMIRQVMMHPEVWFCDVTGGTNRQNRDFFIMAIRLPTGETFPGNITVIPSGQRWVINTLAKSALVFFFGNETVQRNRMTIHDEDISQTGASDDAIATVIEFSKSNMRLCLFHAVWQPFAKLVFKHLPRRSSNSKMLSEKGRGGPSSVSDAQSI